MDLLSLFQLLVIMNWLFLFLSFNNKKNMLLIAIVSLQFILLQYSCAPFVLTTKLYIYIYIYIYQQLYMDLKLAKNSTHELW